MVEDDLDAGGVQVADEGVEARKLGGRVGAARGLEAAPGDHTRTQSAPSPRSISRIMASRAVDSAGSASSCGGDEPLRRRSPAPARASTTQAEDHERHQQGQQAEAPAKPGRGRQSVTEARWSWAEDAHAIAVYMAWMQTAPRLTAGVPSTLAHVAHCCRGPRG